MLVFWILEPTGFIGSSTVRCFDRCPWSACLPLGGITDAVWFFSIHNERVTPSSEQGESASDKGRDSGTLPFL
jgi:hypothetical protein